jgi:predicted SAM-dependent methyltransferase
MKKLIPARLRPAAFAVYKAIWRARHRGNKYQCNICGRSFSEFAPYGVARRKNAMCPECESVERHRLQWSYMKNKTNILKDEVYVLHFAPEAGVSEHLQSQNNIHYVSCDLFDPKVMLKADITNMPFKDNSFDVILCNHVLEHIIDDGRAMKEIYRMLKPNGWAILQVPIDYRRSETYEDPTIVSEDDRLKYFNQKDHVRIYGKDYKTRLQNAGFKVKTDKYASSLSSKDLEKYVLDKDEIIYFCTKK